MIKKMFILYLIVCSILVACSVADAQDNKQSGTYLESVDKYNDFHAIKLVDKESGCKYLVISGTGSSRQSVVQMLDGGGKPLCKY